MSPGNPVGWAVADPLHPLDICQSDIAGARTLQKKWTTFLKSQLGYSVPDKQLYFNQLQAVHTMQGASWHKTTFVGVFHMRW